MTAERDAPSRSRVRLDPSWLAVLGEEFEADYMGRLRAFLVREKSAGKRIYPPGAEIFNALDSTPFDRVRVVILGQDPYHGPGQAHGLCFSVRPGLPPPPSLKNIYRELRSDVGFKPPSHGCLAEWARRGVLLLNAVLTVEAGRAGSHRKVGWERFTSRIIERLNRDREGLVFMLWGGDARKKAEMVDRDRHLALSAPHPSPLSADRGFFGCGHFSQANEYLRGRGEEPIDWQLPADGGVPEPD